MSDSLQACGLQRQASLSITNFRSLLKLMSIELVMPSNHLILCCPLLLSPSIFPSIRVFSSESVFYIRWPKHWSFSFSISPSNEYSGLICSRIDWFDLLAVPGTLKSLLQVLGYSFLNKYFKLSWLTLMAEWIVQYILHPCPLPYCFTRLFLTRKDACLWGKNASWRN